MKRLNLFVYHDLWEVDKVLMEAALKEIKPDFGDRKKCENIGKCMFENYMCSRTYYTKCILERLSQLPKMKEQYVENVRNWLKRDGKLKITPKGDKKSNSSYNSNSNENGTYFSPVRVFARGFVVSENI